MSHFIRVQAQFKDANALCVALQAMGFAKQQIERYETPQRLTSSWSDRAEAEIIVRRTTSMGRNVGAKKLEFDSPVDCPTRTAPALSSGDMGFKLNAKTGEYECTMESMDRHCCPQSWFDTLTQEYATALAYQEYAPLGYSVSRTNLDNGKVQLVMQGF